MLPDSQIRMFLTITSPLPLAAVLTFGVSIAQHVIHYLGSLILSLYVY